MSYDYILLENAQKDYEDSLVWYDERSSQAADNFIVEIHKTITLICEHPARWRNRYKDFYELTLKQFPFTIVYKINDQKELIVISAIYHHKRNPKGKYRKT